MVRTSTGGAFSTNKLRIRISQWHSCPKICNNFFCGSGVITMWLDTGTPITDFGTRDGINVTDWLLYWVSDSSIICFFVFYFGLPNGASSEWVQWKDACDSSQENALASFLRFKYSRNNIITHLDINSWITWTKVTCEVVYRESHLSLIIVFGREFVFVFVCMCGGASICVQVCLCECLWMYMVCEWVCVGGWCVRALGECTCVCKFVYKCVIESVFPGLCQPW